MLKLKKNFILLQIINKFFFQKFKKSGKKDKIFFFRNLKIQKI